MPPRSPVVDGKRRCARCSKWVLLEDFQTYTRKNGKTYYAWCRECTAQYKRENPWSQTKLGQLRDEKRALVEKLKTAPCTDCGQSFPSVCMDFDHVRGTKVKAIAQMVGQTWSVERLLEELKKCELVCSNCHRIRTNVHRDHRALVIAGRRRAGLPVREAA